MRNAEGEVCMAGSHQGVGNLGPTIVEAKACLWGLQLAKEYGWKRIEMEGDCIPLIQKLQMWTTEDNFLGFIVSDILELSRSFDFIAFSFVKGGRGNRVAHDLAHWQPFNESKRVWTLNVPEHIIS